MHTEKKEGPNSNTKHVQIKKGEVAETGDVHVHSYVQAQGMVESLVIQTVKI
jgi:hypothetical protein